jgi:hypothetical protein
MRRVPTWAWVLVLAVVLLVIAPWVIWLGLDAKCSRELESELAKIRAAGEPLTMQKAAPQADSPQTNAATLYLRVFQVSFDPGGSSNQNTGLSRYPVPEAWKAGNMATAETMRPVLADPLCQEDLRVVRQASLRPQCAFPVRWEEGANALFPHMAQMRQATRLAAAQAMLCAKDGQPDEAVDWLCTGYRMADHASLEPTLIGQLVTIAILAITNRATEGILNTVDLTPAQATRLRSAIDRLRLAESFDQGMLGERVLGLTTVQHIRREPLYAAQLGGDSGEAAGEIVALMGAGVFGPYLKLEEANYLRSMSAVVQQVRRPARETKGAPYVVQPGFGNLLSAMMVPVLGTGSMKRDQALAELDLLRTALELRTYRASQGSYPPSLLAPGVTLREDVLSGKPLGYRRQEQGFVIWSVGPNLQDDSGMRPARPGDIQEQGDIVWGCSR